MKITKYGHCCMLVEIDGARILFDPGMFTNSQNGAQNVDIVLITHDHADHYHAESLKAILKNNPSAQVFTNKTMGATLDKEGIKYEVLAHGDSKTAKDILIEGFGKQHAVIYGNMPPADYENTGYFLQNKFFFPGDALFNPGKPVEVLALPVVAPWMKFAEAVDYAKAINPKISFPVHDAIMSFHDFFHGMMQQILKSNGVEFKPLKADESFEA